MCENDCYIENWDFCQLFERLGARKLTILTDRKNIDHFLTFHQRMRNELQYSHMMCVYMAIRTYFFKLARFARKFQKKIVFANGKFFAWFQYARSWLSLKNCQQKQNLKNLQLQKPGGPRILKTHCRRKFAKRQRHSTIAKNAERHPNNFGLEPFSFLRTWWYLVVAWCVVMSLHDKKGSSPLFSTIVHFLRPLWHLLLS